MTREAGERSGPERSRLSDNLFAIGLFCSNRWGGITQTMAPERWDASWQNNLRLVCEAEAAGVDFVLPLGIWRTLGGDAATDGYSYEPTTWAAGLLAATKRIRIFSTVHVSFLHPVMAAKQFVTCNHIGQGRFGVNVVSGGNKPEYDMFGIELLEHDDRYVFTEEWLDIVQRLWLEDEPFDYDGRFFKLKGAKSDPKPYGGARPMVVSAGSSGAGRTFAARHADALFMIVPTLDGLAGQVSSFKAISERNADVLSSGHILCRPTRKEAEDYYNHLIREHGDWKAADTLMNEVFANQQSLAPERVREFRDRFCSGWGTYRIIGDPDDVVAAFARMHDAGLRGMAFALPNYLEDFAIIRDEVMPRMVRASLRTAS